MLIKLSVGTSNICLSREKRSKYEIQKFAFSISRTAYCAKGKFIVVSRADFFENKAKSNSRMYTVVRLKRMRRFMSITCFHWPVLFLL